MDKKIFFFSLILAVNSHGQSSTPNNTWSATRYLGWDASNGTNPLFTRTNNIVRVRLNGTQNATINGVNQNTAGYFGIGGLAPVPTATNGFFNTNSPWAMLHLEGPNTTGFGGNGWRNWMRTGLLMREQSDQMYVGLKAEPGTNRLDAVVSWSDDALGAGSVINFGFCLQEMPPQVTAKVQIL